MTRKRTNSLSLTLTLTLKFKSMWLFSDKVLVRESGLLDGFCDCHCHLLPGVDDGVRERDETMQILEVWASLGVKEVWLTPHIMEDIPNEPEELRKRFETLTGTSTGTIELHLAAEHMMDGPFSKRLEKGPSIMCSAAKCSSIVPVDVPVNVSNLFLNSSGSFGISSMMCGVSHTSFTPSDAHTSRICIVSSLSRTPSSTPGSRWQ